jgi:hypothetical protein
MTVGQPGSQRGRVIFINDDLVLLYNNLAISKMNIAGGSLKK